MLPAEFFGAFMPAVHHFWAGGENEIRGDSLRVVPGALVAQGGEGFQCLWARSDHLGGQPFLTEKAEPNQRVFMLVDDGVEFVT